MGQHALQHHAQARQRHRRSGRAGLVQEDDGRQPRRRGRQSPSHRSSASSWSCSASSRRTAEAFRRCEEVQDAAIRAAWLHGHPHTRRPVSIRVHWENPTEVRPGSLQCTRRPATRSTKPNASRSALPNAPSTSEPFEVKDGRKAAMDNSGFGPSLVSSTASRCPFVTMRALPRSALAIVAVPASSSPSRCSRISCGKCGRTRSSS